MKWKRGESPVALVDAKEIQGVRWHPDSTHIVYAAPSDGPDPITREANWDIWRYAVSGPEQGRKRQLTTSRSYDTLPAPTADGQFVYFISNRDAGAKTDLGDRQIYRMAW